MSPARERRKIQDPHRVLDALESFLNAARRPVLAETGRPEIAVDRDRLRLEATPRGVVLESWSDEGACVRRVTTVVSQTHHMMDLEASRFAGGNVRLRLVDQAATRGRPVTSGGQSSEAFLARLLSRNFPQAAQAGITGSPDLEHSLSGRHVRGILREANVHWAVVAAPPLSGADACDAALATGLLWLDLLRRKGTQVSGLRLFLPHGKEDRNGRLLRRLNPHRAAYELYTYDEVGRAARVDLADIGNVRLRLRRPALPPQFDERVTDWLDQLRRLRGTECVPQAAGDLSVRLRGLEFAKVVDGKLQFAFEEPVLATPATFPRLLTLARELERRRSPDTSDQTDELYRRSPERWLEHQLRANLPKLDPSLAQAPVVSQPSISRGIDRNILDLLAVDASSRLVVIEVKASPNLQLPFQALDYWDQAVATLAEAPSEVERCFAGQVVSAVDPRLVLVAPALQYHPTTEALVGYLSPTIPIERIGLNAGWRGELNVSFRTQGAVSPDTPSVDKSNAFY